MKKALSPVCLLPAWSLDMGLFQVLAGLLMVFFLPGYTLVNLLFPRRGELDPEYDTVYRVALGMGLSIVIAIFVGFALNAISTEEVGYVSAGPLWAALLSLTVAFFAGGWYRGAYPVMGLMHPRLYRPPAPREVAGVRLLPSPGGRAAERLTAERACLLADMDRWSSRASDSNPTKKLYYRNRVEQARQRLGQVNEELERLKEEG